jgi:hypothetical protein
LPESPGSTGLFRAIYWRNYHRETQCAAMAALVGPVARFFFVATGSYCGAHLPYLFSPRAPFFFLTTVVSLHLDCDRYKHMDVVAAPLPLLECTRTSRL